jgi:CDP-glucose 4,6-dehydratase
MNSEFWRGRPVLVTGATGLLGGWLLKSLLDAGAETVVLVRDSVPNCMAVRDRLLERATVVNGSLLEEGLVRRLLFEYSIDTVFHLGAQTLVGVAKQDPVGTLDTNVRGTWILLEAARHSGVKQFLFASSDKAYGISQHLPYRETDPCQGTYPYDVSKSCGDLICRMYAATYRLPVAIVRCGNLYGGGDLNFSRTIPGVIQATIRDERLVIRSDGQFIRDFLYVKDAANAYTVLAEHLAADRTLIGEAFNFSLELRLTVLEIVQRVLSLMGRDDLAPCIQNTASSEIREQYMSSEKARKVLSWKPEYTLEHGLSETISWYQDYFRVSAEQIGVAAGK